VFSLGMINIKKKERYIMGWGKWKKDGKEHVKEKTVQTSSGKEHHTLRSKNGDRENHSHVYVKRNNNGSSSAHYEPPKKERRPN